MPSPVRRWINHDHWPDPAAVPEPFDDAFQGPAAVDSRATKCL